MRLPALFDVWMLGAVLVAVMGVAMWADRAPVTCTMRPELVRALYLTRGADREHLARDLNERDRIVGRIAGAATSVTDRQQLADACEASLVQQIMTTHGVTAAQIRTSSR